MNDELREATENELLQQITAMCGDLQRVPIQQITAMCGDLQRVPSKAPYIRDLAEAFAWVSYPNQPHGGSGTVSVRS